MLPFLSVLKHPLSIALTAALMGTAAYVVVLETENMHLTQAKAELATSYATSQTQISVLGTQNKTLADSIDQLSVEIKQVKSSTEVMSAEFDASAKRTEETNSILKDIQNAPKTDDAPLAPVLRRTFDGLRGHSNATPVRDNRGH